jgi:competence protein ComEA
MLFKSSPSGVQQASERSTTGGCAALRPVSKAADRSRKMRNVFAFFGLAFILWSGVAQAGSEAQQAPLDLNRATSAQLEALPGIGQVKAAAILAVRDANGGFESIDELEAVRGIGPALAMKLKPLLKVDSKARKSAKTTSK